MITATLFLVFAVITILGMPIALALVGGGMAAIVAGDLMPLFTSVQKMFSSVDSFTLAAIPFFMLAGALMSSGGISRRLIDFANAAVGWMPGGLGVVTIFSCMLFGCLCGSPTATVAAIGAVMVPALEQGGYSRKFALSTIAAAGMLGTIIPPSTVMITYCSATGVSVGSMFMAGIVPGITLGALMIAFAIFYGVKIGSLEPSLISENFCLRLIMPLVPSSCPLSSWAASTLVFLHLLSPQPLLARMA